MSLRPATTASAIAGALREDIARGALTESRALAQNTLAARFGVSHIPVREALRQLESEGLIAISPNRGATVTRLSLDDIREMFDLRILLECNALMHAVKNVDAVTLKRIALAQTLMEEATDKTAWLALDAEFHHLLYAPSERRRTLGLLQPLRLSVERYCLVYLDPITRNRVWKREHRAILSAVRAGQPLAAAEALQAHLDSAAKLVLQAAVAEAPVR